MRKRNKVIARIFASFLVVCMVLQIVPVISFAKDDYIMGKTPNSSVIDASTEDIFSISLAENSEIIDLNVNSNPVNDTTESNDFTGDVVEPPQNNPQIPSISVPEQENTNNDFDDFDFVDDDFDYLIEDDVEDNNANIDTGNVMIGNIGINNDFDNSLSDEERGQQMLQDGIHFFDFNDLIMTDTHDDKKVA